MTNLKYVLIGIFCLFLFSNLFAQSTTLPAYKSEAFLTPPIEKPATPLDILKSTTSNTTAALPSGALILWGGPGDDNGEFNGGLNDWTTTGMDANGVNTPWVWEADADVSEGAFAPDAPINSPSANNGAAVFNSDFYDNGGDQSNQGGGTNPAPHFADLISPIIDLNNEENIAISFYTYYRNFQNTVSLSWSNDGGVTWSEAIPVHDTKEAPTNVNALNSRKLIYLPGAGDTEEFQFKFTFAGEYYFWMIDDVAIIEQPQNDLKISSFFYTPANYAQPEAHIDADVFSFSMNITNAGLAAQNNVILGAQVRDMDNNIIYETTTDVAEIAVGVTDSTYQIPGTFVPDMLDQNSYMLTYTIDSDSTDQWLDDNLSGDPFRVSDLQFATEDGDQNWESYFTPSGNPSWQIGNVYQTGSGFGADYYTVESITFAGTTNANDPIEGKTVNVWLLEISEDINAGFGNLSDDYFATNPDLTIVGFGVHTFAEGEGQDRITVPLEDFEGASEIILKENTRYLALIDYSVSNTIFQAFNTKIDYGERLNFLAYNENSGSWFGGFTDGDHLLPVIRLQLGLNTVNTKDQLLPNAVLRVSPNPSNGDFTLQIDLETASKASLVVTDITGKVLHLRDFDGMKSANIPIDLSNYPNGTYLVRLATEAGARTERIVVQH